MLATGGQSRAASPRGGSTGEASRPNRSARRSVSVDIRQCSSLTRRPTGRTGSAGLIPSLGARNTSFTGCEPGPGAKPLEAHREPRSRPLASGPVKAATGSGQQLAASAVAAQFFLQRRRRKLDERPQNLLLGRVRRRGAPEFLPDGVGLPPVRRAEQLLPMEEERGIGERRQRNGFRGKQTWREMLEKAVSVRIPLGVGSLAGPVPIGRKWKTRERSAAQRSRQITNSASASSPSR